MSTGLGLRFWTNLLLFFIFGIAAGFTLCRFVGTIENLFVVAAISIGLGSISGYGILFRFPKPETNESAIGRYAFWPGLLPGSALNMNSLLEAKTALLITLLSVFGFLFALIVWLRYEFKENCHKKEM